MIKGSHKIRIPNPHMDDIRLGLLREILDQAGTSSERWDKA